MLQAMTKKGVLVTLPHATRNEIMEWKKAQMEFYCPVCKERVMMKAGIKNIAHFAHYQEGECTANEGGEGAYHEKGKLALYNWVAGQQINVQLEEYLPQIQQRPDMLVNLKGRKIAIEYQCVRIPTHIIQQRNKGYMLAGITPIWILGMTLFQRKVATQFKINDFLTQFIHQFSPDYPLCIYFFCAETFQFLSIHDIYILRTGTATGKFHIQSLPTIGFLDLFTSKKIKPKELYTLWMKEKHRFRLYQPTRLFGKSKKWYQWLYLKGLHRETLPSLIHLPVVFQMRMKSPLYEWQSRLLLDYLSPIPIGASFTLSSCHTFLSRHHQLTEQFPLLHSPANPIQEYLEHLVVLKILDRLNGNYVKRREVKKPTSLENALAADRVVLEKLLKQNPSMIPR
ncbi:competence protein CoiA [Virgibacillus sp. SK37]|uniref:competence protein CoiA n=1 Tax=Virgibacillus sp. SK37 TaxID=403957 RepID=UPI0004D10E8D|nr:competence protein CoiA family protein [Virgibacillus sp. SK37]AIF45222.1 hypothetical protein X953_05580 [Virgibacillus sp. SK37]